MVATGMVGILQTLLLRDSRPNEGEPEFGKRVMKDLKAGPARDGLAMMFYAGFKLGQRSVELEQLEKLGGSK